MADGSDAAAVEARLVGRVTRISDCELVVGAKSTTVVEGCLLLAVRSRVPGSRAMPPKLNLQKWTGWSRARTVQSRNVGFTQRSDTSN